MTVKAAVVRWAFTALGWTYRYSSVEGAESLEHFRASSKSAIISFWHSRIIVCSHYLATRWHRRGYHMHVLVSSSGDGEIIARWIHSIGGSTSRGSSSRGGTAALRSMVRSIKARPGGKVTTPDGPRGPEREVQAGTVLLAQLSGVPVLPMSFAAERAWRLNSWDRMIVPKPFSRLHIVYGEPIEVPGDLDEPGRETFRLRLQSAIRRADARAAELAGTDV